MRKDRGSKLGKRRKKRAKGQSRQQGSHPWHGEQGNVAMGDGRGASTSAPANDRGSAGNRQNTARTSGGGQSAVNGRPWHEQVGMGAEYRFVPFCGQVAPAPVRLDDGAAWLSHAKPLPGGFSGCIEVVLEAATPVLFGMASDEAENATVPQRLYADGPWCMNGRTARGMIRSVYRIITCSYPQPINTGHRFARRDPDYLKSRNQEKAKSKAGWLVWNGDSWELYEAGEFEDILLKDIEQICGTSNWRKKDLSEKLEDLSKCGDKLKFRNGKHGWIFASGASYNRKKEKIVTFDNGRKIDMNLTFFDEAWKNFIFMNTEYKKNRRTLKEKGNFTLWLAEYLNSKGAKDFDLEKVAKSLQVDVSKGDLEKLRKKAKGYKVPGVPIWFRKGPGGELWLGTAQLFHIPYKNSVGDVLQERPEKKKGRRLDWTEALFGTLDARAPDDEKGASGNGEAVGKGTAETGGQTALRGRVEFGFAVAEQHTCELMPEKGWLYALQGAPKASYEPFYLSRKEENGKPADYDRGNAILNGYKRYPARPLGMVNEALARMHRFDRRRKNVISRVRVLKEGARFVLPIRFHNLHPLELGALLWAISFGQRAVFGETETDIPCRHMAGRLKNKGLGQLKVKAVRCRWLRQNPLPAGERLVDVAGDWPAQADALMQAFEAHMGRWLTETEKREKKKRNKEGRTEAAAREEFWSARHIIALLMLSDPDFEPEGRDKKAMLSLPKPKDNGHFNFKPFQELRKRVLVDETLPPKSWRSVLDDFVMPPIDWHVEPPTPTLAEDTLKRLSQPVFLVSKEPKEQANKM